MKDIKKEYPMLFEDKKKEINRMYEDSWNQARKIAKILKNKYGAETIIAFGSLTEKNRFHKRSDIDLAVEGISDEKFYEAYGEITGKFSDFKVDLVDIKDFDLLSARFWRHERGFPVVLMTTFRTDGVFGLSRTIESTNRPSSPATDSLRLISEAIG